MKMRKVFIAAIIVTISQACTVQQINQTLDDYLKGDKLTSEEVTSGLREALIQGITKGSNNASKKDGFLKNSLLKIPFPPDAIKVANTLRDLGLNRQVDRFIITLNRGAEDAAKSAKPIFISAIKQMTIQDAWGILRGENNAATEYLKKTTSSPLYDSFKPIIQNSLEKVNATKYYGDLVTRYNQVPFVDKVNPDLDDYATNLAMEGLFKLIASEEANIRKDPIARTTAILKKVFGAEK